MSSVLELQSTAMGIYPANYGSMETSQETGSSGSPSKSAAVLRLREPRDLYSTTSLQHPPKWPIECQVIPEGVRHIPNGPKRLEPFYVPTGGEPQPKPVGEEMGTVVYNYQPKLSVDYFCRSCVGGSDLLEPHPDLAYTDPNCLRFESRFESGNLAKAIKVTSVYYELHLRQDLYTDRHSQWFYFRVQNMKEGLLYRFSIVNFNKADSLYKYGLKPLMYSEKEAQLNKIGWVRSGQGISYFKNDLNGSSISSAGSDESSNGFLYTLTFTVKFKHSNDTIYFAHCYPYTYTQLQNYLRSLEDDQFKKDLLTVRLLCRSLAGNNVYVVTITSPEGYNNSEKKPAIVISARVHPGETQSSYMIKGITDFLTSDNPQAKELRDRFIFKLIPMLNPDGVIVGNSRCCLLGQDLNRQYRTVLREAFPQIYQTKVLLRRLAETNGVFLYCDIHGHSRRNNVFIYGCENRRFQDAKTRLVEQVFPLMMQKNAADKFSFENCKFRVQKNKEGTGRVFAWTLGIINSYTLEISVGGSTLPSRPGTHLNTSDYEAMGRHFCETLLDFSDPSEDKERLRDKILQKLSDQGSNADQPVNVNLSDYSSISHSESEDSDNEFQDKDEDTPKSGEQAESVPINKALVPPTVVITKDDGTKKKTLVSLTKQVSVATVTTTTLKFTRQGPGQQPRQVVLADELAVFKRLTKFRRRRKLQTEDVQVTKKYSSVLYDDPFNPPTPLLPHKKKEDPLFYDDNDSSSSSEDECNYEKPPRRDNLLLPAGSSDGGKPNMLVTPPSLPYGNFLSATFRNLALSPGKPTSRKQDPSPRVPPKVSVLPSSKIVNSKRTLVKKRSSLEEPLGGGNKLTVPNPERRRTSWSSSPISLTGANRKSSLELPTTVTTITTPTKGKARNVAGSSTVDTAKSAKTKSMTTATTATRLKTKFDKSANLVSKKKTRSS